MAEGIPTPRAILSLWSRPPFAGFVLVGLEFDVGVAAEPTIPAIVII